MAPRKRRIDEIQTVAEPMLPPEGITHLRQGAALFNDGAYWHAHEAWETAWLMMPEGPEGDAEIILRGLIQLAASLHLKEIGREDGAASNLRKAREKLALSPPHLMGFDIEALRQFIRAYENDATHGNAPRICIPVAAGL
jgi:predicted metal-dependent hydrolase